MGLENYTCCICGGPDDPSEPQLVVIPKAVAHKRCYDSSGKDITALANGIPCCTAKATLSSFGGHFLVRKKAIPLDEVWVGDAAAGDILRYRILGDGTMQKLDSPKRPERPKAAEEG